jgi:hypothetical protein
MVYTKEHELHNELYVFSVKHYDAIFLVKYKRDERGVRLLSIESYHIKTIFIP